MTLARAKHVDKAFSEFLEKAASNGVPSSDPDRPVRPGAALTAKQALALFDGMDFVTPDHIQELAIAVIAHRLMLDSQARLAGITQTGVVENALRTVPVPA